MGSKITYGQLLHLGLSPLSQAVEAWELRARRVKDPEADCEPDVLKPFREAGRRSGDGTSRHAERQMKANGDEVTEGVPPTLVVSGSAKPMPFPGLVMHCETDPEIPAPPGLEGLVQ